MDEHQVHAGEAKLSASFAKLYKAAVERNDGQQDCYNCAVKVDAPTDLYHARGLRPLCGVCWQMLQTSIKLAAQKGFRIG